ncbi:hypothetical protein BUALT_Bualt16G0064800 [Buddleja alternifolia]|uniref:Uncharacterized protein n=1 Tax=Buddleja alternifolia TaxID=168488 RepID=A0AAV6WB43_9LAMI|nr:hypothetical protein BUALT_Bualt16G0064800 [Buddleja alternifolia]
MCSMDIGLISLRLRGIHIERLLYFVGILTAVLALLHLFAYPNGSYLASLSHANVVFVSLTTDGKPFSNNSNLADSYILHGHTGDRDDVLASDDMGPMDSELATDNRNLSHGSIFEGLGHVNYSYISAKNGSFRDRINISSEKEFDSMKLKVRSNTNISSVPLQGGSLSSADNSVMYHKPAFRKRGGKAMSIAQMNSLLRNISVEMKSKKPRWSSSRDQELQDAKAQIENAPIQRNISEAHASLFWNYSMFKRGNGQCKLSRFIFCENVNCIEL